MTNPVQPAAPAPNPPEHFDEHSGVYGFFRRHQKKLLYTAGLFTLLTFSISGPMLASIDDLFRKNPDLPTISVNGTRVPLTVEDYDIGRQLAGNAMFAVPRGVMPSILGDADEQNELGDAYAILRRAAIVEGFEAPMSQVDAAIETLREQAKAESAHKLAQGLNFASLAQYRNLVAEAMRIGTYLKLQSLALDSSEAEVLRQVLLDREKITLRVATFDEKKAEDELKAQKPQTDDDLHKWLDGKSDRDKRVMQAYDSPLADLRVLALLLADGQFDPEQWKESHLKDFTVADDQLQGLYEQEKENRFKLEGDKQYKPFDDAAVKTELTRLAQAEHVMNQLLTALRGKQAEQQKPAVDEINRTNAELGSKQAALSETDTKLATEQNTLASLESQLAQKPDDADLKQKVEAGKAAVAKLKDDQFKASEAIPALKAAVKAAEDAKKEADAKFDLFAAAAELTKDKKGFVTKESTEKKSTEVWKDLDAEALKLDLGKWPTVNFGGLQKGSLGFAPGRTSKAVVLFQAKDVDMTPLKPWDKLKPLVETAYFTELAKKQGEEKKKAMEEALLRLAKAKMPEKVAEIEGKKQARIDEKVKEWETTTKTAIEKARTTLAGLSPGTKVHATWEAELKQKEGQLATRDAQLKRFEAEVTKAIEVEVGDEAKKLYKDVLDQAAAEAGFTVSELPAYPRDLAERTPRFDKVFDPRTVYLMRSQSQLKVGDATTVLQDFTNRQYHVVVCTKAEPLGPGDVTRRDFESLRTGDGNVPFASSMAFRAFQQSFGVKALEVRYDLQQKVGVQREEASKPVDDNKGK
ncbi:MAG: hypothetical protein JNK15_08825 [Planctomycetes bacterium]|nr:hypothetical protein [Planctomycetota bacterium]